MSDYIIKVENLGKKYRIRHQAEQQRYVALRDVIANGVKGFGSKVLDNGRHLFSRNGTATQNPDSLLQAPCSELQAESSALPAPSAMLHAGAEDFWALRGVSFEVKRGEVVGIIGRNGAGKSTLLKILSRITEPTEGRVRIRGRVASLLEVGTGFHPELTGRENIFVNGAVLGMTRQEVRRKFDEIVAFAEVERFLDTPVKRYSSGMYVRLAFAVAAHLEPEILLVDEVLAVGDTQFQKKCLGKMGEVAKGGRTVLFVSHQINQIRRLCQTCVWLDANQLRKKGPTSQIITAYDRALNVTPLNLPRDNVNQNATARFIKWEILHPIQEKPNILCTTGPVTMRFILKVNDLIKNGHHGIFLYNNENHLIWGTDAQNLQLRRGLYELLYSLPSLPLRPGIYYWRVNLYREGIEVDSWECLPELVVATTPVTHSRDEWTGILNLPYSLSIGDLQPTNRTTSQF